MGDTDLWIRIEDDLTEPADQALWGYAKNLRSRMNHALGYGADGFSTGGVCALPAAGAGGAH